MLLRLAGHVDATFSSDRAELAAGREGGRRGWRGPERRRRMRVGWSRRGRHVDLHRSPSRNFAAPAKGASAMRTDVEPTVRG